MLILKNYLVYFPFLLSIDEKLEYLSFTFLYPSHPDLFFSHLGEIW